MGNAFLLIFPSKWNESFSRVVVEAFATGTPVIASNLAEMEQFVTPFKNGLLFSPGNADDLLAQIEWALKNQKKISQMRLQARKTYEEYYTADKNYEMLHNIYEGALSE